MTTAVNKLSLPHLTDSTEYAGRQNNADTALGSPGFSIQVRSTKVV